MSGQTATKRPHGFINATHLHDGAALNFTTFAGVRNQRADIPILDTPYQLVKRTIARFAFNALHTHYTTTRTMLAQAKEIDPDIYHSAISELGAKEANYIRSIATLSVVGKAIKCRIEGAQDDRCIFFLAKRSNPP